MIKKLKLLMFALALSVTSAAPALVPASVGAATNNIQDQICNGSKTASGTATDCQNAGLGDGSQLQQAGKKVVNFISILVGIISIVFIIYGGFRYITSGGDSGRVGNAKNTLIYAVIGLIVVALAQLIVNFVLSTSTNITTP